MLRLIQIQIWIDNFMPKFIVDGIEFNSEDLSDQGNSKLESMRFVEKKLLEISLEIDIFKLALAVLLNQVAEEIIEKKIGALNQGKEA